MSEGPPPTGSVWRHHSGRTYRVLMLTNTGGDGVKYPHTVVYEGCGATPPNRWSDPLDDWHRRMTRVEGD
jgi:hypothetical protein